jgi:Mrp family chromosome partitioning ATPase
MQPLEESFRILRLTVAGRFAGPAAFAVTSARRGDGTSYVAMGLARAFAETGEATLLVRASSAGDVPIVTNGSGTMTALGRAVAVPGAAHLEIVSIAPPRSGGPSHLDIAAALDDVRTRYRAVVVDAAPLPESSQAFAFVRAVDGVVLAVRLGRAVVDADRDLKRLLAESGAHMLGVVPTRGHAASAATPPTTPAPADSEGAPRIATRPIEVSP